LFRVEHFAPLAGSFEDNIGRIVDQVGSTFAFIFVDPTRLERDKTVVCLPFISAAFKAGLRPTR
jgi:hypothetical protein